MKTPAAGTRRILFLSAVFFLMTLLTGCPQPGSVKPSEPQTPLPPLSLETADIWVVDWREQIFTDTSMPAEAQNGARLLAAKNSAEAFQLCVRAKKSVLTVSGIDFSDLKNGSITLPASFFSYRFVDHIQANQNSRNSDDGISHPVRTAPAAFPEILSNDTSRPLALNSTMSLWIKVSIPEGTAAGTYTGSCTLKTSAGNVNVPLSVKVFNVTIPQASLPQSFTLELWGQLVGNTDTAVDVIQNAYGAALGSPQWKQVLHSFAQLFKENRLNSVLVNQTDLLIAGGTTVTADGTVNFNWSLFDEFVQLFLDEGGAKQFALSPLAKYKAVNDGSGTDFTNSQTEIIIRASDDHAQKKLVLYNPATPDNADGKAARSYLAQYLSALKTHLEAKGWTPLFYHHVIDEAGNDQQWKLYRALRDLIAAKNPALKTGDATTPWKAQQLKLQGLTMDNWIFMLDQFEVEGGDWLSALKKPGDTVWLYTSNYPLKDGYLNRTMDSHIWKIESLAWLCYKRGANGYLHWGLNQWNTWLNGSPFPDYPAAAMDEKTLGDSSCVYPDKAYSLRSSIRVEALREASEQYSLLQIAATKNLPAANALVQKNIRSGNDYETDIEKLASYYEELLKLAEN